MFGHSLSTKSIHAVSYQLTKHSSNRHSDFSLIRLENLFTHLHIYVFINNSWKTIGKFVWLKLYITFFLLYVYLSMPVKVVEESIYFLLPSFFSCPSHFLVIYNRIKEIDIYSLLNLRT